MAPESRVISLTEYQPLQLSAHSLTQQEGQRLWDTFGIYVSVDFPTPKSNDQWQLTAQGWAGFLSVSARLGLRLLPKVPIADIFGMIETVYGLERYLADTPEIQPRLYEVDSVKGLYQGLVTFFLDRIERLLKKGLFHDYVRRTETLPYVRGTLLLDQALSNPTQQRVPSRYDELSTDIDDNRILLWTLWTLMQNKGWGAEIRHKTRYLFNQFAGSVTLQPFAAQDCAKRLYTLLNQEYRLLHAICRFLLDQTSPNLQMGTAEFSGFLINLPVLYERYVAHWLQDHLPAEYRLHIQERAPYGQNLQHYFHVDLALYAGNNIHPLMVMDTKYKRDSVGSSSRDVAQVVAYATAKGSNQAVLIYPTALDDPLDAWIGPIRVRAVSFDLSLTSEEAGSRLWRDLLSGL